MAYSTYNTNNGFAQAGGGTANALFLNSKLTPNSISFAQAAGGANVAEVTLQLLDGAGNALERAMNVEIWLSDAATGLGITGTTASGTVTAKTASGTVLTALTAKKHIIAQTKTDGTFILEITDTGNTGFYVAATCPTTGEIVVSDAITAYGA